MKRRYSGFLLMLTLMFAVILGFIPGLETAMTVHAEEESEVSEESSEAEGVIASGTCGGKLTWLLEDDGTLTLSGTGEMPSYEDLYWYGVWYGTWQQYRNEIKKIIVNEGFTSIDGWAFENCNNVNEVILPTSIQYIGMSSFAGCTSLSKITIPDGVQKIGEDAFSGCTSLSEMTIPDSVQWIGGDAFSGCTSLSEITISNGVQYITGFSGCTSLSEITIPDSVQEIGYRAFENCTNLSEITIPDSVQEIGGNAFSGCTSLSEITIPDSVQEIGESAFSGCTSLSEVTISDSVQEIGYRAFENCTNLSEITIPDSVQEIGGNAFSGCTSLSEITIPNSVQEIGEGAFYGCTSLSEVTISDSVQKIGGGAFRNCTSLSEITIPDSVQEIGESAFSGCTSLKAITIPEGILVIDKGTFRNCSSLEKITIASTVTQINEAAFAGCNKLSKIIFSGSAPIIAKAQWKTLYNPGMSSGGGGYYKEWYDGAFQDVIANVYYPLANSTWTKEIRNGNYGAEFIWIGYESDLTTPAKPYKIANVVSGVHVYWNAVSGATKYGLWRSETGANGSYKWIGNPTTNHFTDTKVESGKTYYYCVSTCNPKTNAHSIISEPLGITYVSTPDITNRMNLAAGVKLTWNKINGATGYAIYRKPYTGNAAWVRVETISGNETFTWTDKSVASANGTLYRYTIRALAGTNMKTLSGCRNTGRTMARLTSRTLNSVTKTAATSVKCTWSTTAQASGYEVRFMNGSTVVKQFTVGNYKTGAKTFTGIPTGANYKVQVRSYKKVDGVGVFYSAWSTSKYVNL